MSDINKILDAIEAGTVRIRWAHDDEHALTEAQAMAADVRALLVLLADTAHTEADPLPDPYEVAERMAVPRRNCLTCQHDEDGFCNNNARGIGIGAWIRRNCDGSTPNPDADNCPGYTLRPLTQGAACITGRS